MRMEINWEVRERGGDRAGGQEWQIERAKVGRGKEGMNGW